MGIYDKFKTDANTEAQGIFLELGDVRIRVARAGGSNQKYEAAMAEIYRKHSRAIQNDLMDNARGRVMLYEVYAKTVITGWQTKTDEDEAGNPIWSDGIEAENSDDLLPVTQENIVTTFKNLPDLFVHVKDAAEKSAFYRASLVDGAVKN